MNSCTTSVRVICSCVACGFGYIAAALPLGEYSIGGSSVLERPWCVPEEVFSFGGSMPYAGRRILFVVQRDYGITDPYRLTLQNGSKDAPPAPNGFLQSWLEFFQLGARGTVTIDL